MFTCYDQVLRARERCVCACFHQVVGPSRMSLFWPGPNRPGGIRFCVENPLTLSTVVVVVNSGTVYAHTVVALLLSLCETPIVTSVDIAVPKIVSFFPPRDAYCDSNHKMPKKTRIMSFTVHIRLYFALSLS